MNIQLFTQLAKKIQSLAVKKNTPYGPLSDSLRILIPSIATLCDPSHIFDIPPIVSFNLCFFVFCFFIFCFFILVCIH